MKTTWGKKLPRFGEFVNRNREWSKYSGFSMSLFNPAPQAANMHINSTVGNKRVVTPNVVKNLISRINSAGILRLKKNRSFTSVGLVNFFAVNLYTA